MPREDIIRSKKFREINLGDPFFDSLRAAYQEFDAWFLKKAKEEAYVLQDDAGNIQAFLYLKLETGSIKDIEPPLNTARCLKVGTFKINAHGTRLGERFVKKIYDHAIYNGVKHIYVTVFSEHEGLIGILKRYGFYEYGKKIGSNGVEKVFLKDFNALHGNVVHDYPVVDARRSNKWLLAIHPPWHTKLFPDSILQTEDANIIQDLSFTNSIHKVYITWMDGLSSVRVGDLMLIYRTKDGRSAWHSSVATSICVVEDIRPRSGFENEEAFVKYCRQNSVFSEVELRDFYKRRLKNEMYTLRLTYNIALPKRPTMKRLVEDAGLAYEGYWGFRSITNDAFKRILEMGEVNEGVIVY